MPQASNTKSSPIAEGRAAGSQWRGAVVVGEAVESVWLGIGFGDRGGHRR